MLARIRSWMRDEGDVRNERGNSFALFIMLMPLIMGIFGTGVDLSRNVYIRQSLQNDLDLAVAAGAAVTDAGPGGTPIINTLGSIDEVERVYHFNRKQGPRLICQNVYSTPAVGANERACWNPSPQWRVVPAPLRDNTGQITTFPSVTYNVREQSANTFLPVVYAFMGQNNPLRVQRYNLTSQAILKQRTQ